MSTNTTENMLQLKDIDSIKIRNILTEFKNIFQTEISEYQLCTAGKHTIETLISKPIVCGTSRNPVHWEKDLEEEIQNNLELGIICPSKIPGTLELFRIKKKMGPSGCVSTLDLLIK